MENSILYTLGREEAGDKPTEMTIGELVKINKELTDELRCLDYILDTNNLIPMTFGLKKFLEMRHLDTDRRLKRILETTIKVSV
ncbi:MAG: hypothetical protein GX369_08365 [Euryarchaeota archaeon]|nr:hypothetical protein [Euryarchaeota archaeon]